MEGEEEGGEGEGEEKEEEWNAALPDKSQVILSFNFRRIIRAKKISTESANTT